MSWNVHERVQRWQQVDGRRSTCRPLADSVDGQLLTCRSRTYLTYKSRSHLKVKCRAVTRRIYELPATSTRKSLQVGL
jgi:hypothetical protein